MTKKEFFLYELKQYDLNQSTINTIKDAMLDGIEINDLLDTRINLLSKEIDKISKEQNELNGNISSNKFKLKNYLMDLEQELISFKSFINSKLDNSELKNCNYFKYFG